MYIYIGATKMNTIVTYNTLKFTKIDFTENSELSDQIQFLENMHSGLK